MYPLNFLPIYAVPTLMVFIAFPKDSNQIQKPHQRSFNSAGFYRTQPIFQLRYICIQLLWQTTLLVSIEEGNECVLQKSI